MNLRPVMTPEQRRCPRLKLALKVDIYLDRWILGGCRILNASATGLFIAVRGLKLSDRPSIAINFPPNPNVPLPSIRVWAEVAHVNPNGAGLTLDRPIPELIHVANRQRTTGIFNAEIVKMEITGNKHVSKERHKRCVVFL